MQDEYQENGFVLARGFFSEAELTEIEPVLRVFHENWLNDNQAFYENGAINSAYITHKDALTPSRRTALLDFIATDKLLKLAQMLIPNGPAFMGTQLFFDPKHSDRKNYWHRDGQYNSDDISEQKAMLTGGLVLHFRVPLVDERGIELMPRTHFRWDTDLEYATRTAADGRNVFDDLPDSKAIPLNRGDLLVFNANMIHRGLYGGNRFALDIIFCDTDPELLRFVQPDCLPDMQELNALAHPQIFQATLQALRS
ncbi:MAG: phytanoyl-CoA dioxygenase family protein [Kordiimonadaceae bacterium]|nr:phytanoyl-CoA dioxygenase family protein [Kordiimonadaceae bacterium]MBO6567730.1 phytanoyl-CoA dioxygenase family protein [Kordiimonadaceae bacterium]MBO6963055.1 phytanoyl-CoA dioxygenase family protein [Kordiimonadaceae bacterium]